MRLLVARRPGRRPRAIFIAAAIAGTLAPLAAVTSCIIADPPPDLPPLPKHHPIIVREAVVPPLLKILPAIPATFIVPVELIDPNTAFSYRVFLDLDSSGATPAQLVLPVDNHQPAPADIDGGVTNIEFNLDGVGVDPSICHTISIFVALSFPIPRSLNTPDSFGADSAGWIYNPTGEPGGCPYYDAGGADGAFPDASADMIFIPQPGDGGGS